jgi:lipopolysaccharide/colanic/teichoic acid biosynthesis glycosyltransferase
MLKRAFDLIVAGLATFFLSPLFGLLALLIKLEDGGPVFYRGSRIGKGAKPFRILKFRTMVPNADKIGPPSAGDDDPRITRIGKWLRTTKLDELPQLVNVIMGDMSLVGPRPEVKSEVDRYDEKQMLLLTVRPGITDYSSIEFHNEGEILRGSADPHEAYRRLIQPRKIELGLEYVRCHSLLRDILILWGTIRVVFGGSPQPRLPPPRVMRSIAPTHRTDEQ